MVFFWSCFSLKDYGWGVLLLLHCKNRIGKLVFNHLPLFLCLHLHIIVGGPFQHRSGDLPLDAENYGERGGGEVSTKLKSYKPIFFFSHTFVFIGCLQANYYKSLFSDYFCFLFVVPSTKSPALSFPLFFPYNLKFIPADDGCESICDLVVSCAVFIQSSFPIQSENGSSRQRDDCLSLRRRQEHLLETQISSLHYCCRKIEIKSK